MDPLAERTCFSQVTSCSPELHVGAGCCAILSGYDRAYNSIHADKGGRVVDVAAPPPPQQEVVAPAGDGSDGSGDSTQQKQRLEQLEAEVASLRRRQRTLEALLPLFALLLLALLTIRGGGAAVLQL